MSFDHDPVLNNVESLQHLLRLEQEKNENLTTQLKKTSQVLDHYRQAVDNSPNAIFSINRNGHITTWNPSCVSTFKYNSSIIGKHVGLLLHDNSQLHFIENEILKVVEAMTFSNLDLIYRCRTGETREMVSRIYPVENEKGVVLGFVFANTDVTERNRIHRELDQYRHQLEDLVEERTAKLKDEIQQRKIAQQGLQASYDALVTILDSMDLAIRVVSLEQDEVIFCNNRLKNILAKGKRSVPDYQLFQPLVEKSSVTDREMEFEQERKENPEERNVTWFDPATSRWYLLQEQVITWVDSRRVRLQVATDITERKQIDGERQRVEKLESLGVLAGGIAHDFNNLLTGIMGSLSLLRHQADVGVPNIALLDTAVRATSRATSLTQQLLTFSKGGDPVRTIMAVDEVLSEAISFSLRGSAVKATICLDEPLYYIEGDPGQLSQVFHNLAINAREAMAGGGALAVSAVNCIVGEQHVVGDLPLGKYIKIEFCDNGTGISPEIMDKIFDPYFSTKVKGEGLGLAMVHTIISKHKGKITVEPNSERGVTFKVLLPATEHAAADKTRELTGVIKSGGRILLMDDEETIREVSEAILSHLGYTVDTVPDGETFLSRFQDSLAEEDGYKAVILDLTIPGGMGGEEVARRLAQINPRVPVIASSGYSDSPVMADYRRFGFAAVLKKPYEVAEMAEVLRKVIG